MKQTDIDFMYLYYRDNNDNFGDYHIAKLAHILRMSPIRIKYWLGLTRVKPLWILYNEPLAWGEKINVILRGYCGKILFQSIKPNNMYYLDKVDYIDK